MHTTISHVEPTPDIHIQGSGQYTQIQNDKEMSLVIKMVIMYHICPLSTETEAKKPMKCLKHS